MGMKEGNHLVVENGRAEADAGVYGVEWRPGGAALKRKLGWKKSAPRLEIAGGGSSFVSAKFINGPANPDGRKERVEPDEGLSNVQWWWGGGTLWRRTRGRRGRFGGELFGVAGGETLEDAPLVVEFGHDDLAGDLQAKGGIEGAPVLLEPRETVVILGGKEAAKEFSGPGENLNGDSALKDGGKGRRGEVDALADNESFEVAERDFTKEFLTLAFVLAAVDFESFSLEVNA